MPEKEEQLLKFPCDFPVKVAAVARDGIRDDVEAAARAHAPDAVVEGVKKSSKGNYASVTVRFTATSRKQLDSLYKSLHKVDGVRFVL